MSFINYINSFLHMRDHLRFGCFWPCANKNNDYLQIYIKIIVVIIVVVIVVVVIVGIVVVVVSSD